MSNLFNVEIEQAFFATILKFPQTWGDVAFHLNDGDFSPVNQRLFSVLHQRLGKVPQESVEPVVLAQTLAALGYSIDNIDLIDYLEGLKIKSVSEEGIVDLAKEIKRLSLRREMIEKAEIVQKTLKANQAISFDAMTAAVEKTFSGIETRFFKSETVGLFDDLIEKVEERGNNPIDAEQMGLMGPHEAINRTLGALSFPGSFTTVAARSGDQKSSFGFHYQIHLAIKYKLPLLLMDCGEMTVERIQHRAVCCLSDGRIPLWAIKSGEWRKNRQWTDIIRGEIWPMVKGLKVDFVGVGGMSPKEKISFIRRYYYNKVGRGNHLLILDDYLKGVEAIGKNTSEHQAIGYYVGDVKTLITEEIIASFWTSVQQNRGGSYIGKAAKDVVDSDANVGLSDRIMQQSDWGFLMRRKIPEELAIEQGMFGNMVFKPVKTRELLGRDFERSLSPVKLPSGGFTTNYYNIDHKSFAFFDKGDLRSMYEALGKMAVNLRDVEGAGNKEAGL